MCPSVLRQGCFRLVFLGSEEPHSRLIERSGIPLDARMQKQHCRYAVLATFVTLFGTPTCADAQRVFFGAGVGAASVPRALAPLCGSGRRLNGADFSAQAGFLARLLRVSASLDYTARGYTDVASCVPRMGISVDSTFGPSNTAALTASGDGWFLATRYLSVGAGAGWVPGRDPWFTSGGIGLQYRKVRAEIVGRRHHVSFDEITREFTNPGVREISRSSHTEHSWGGLVRFLFVTR